MTILLPRRAVYLKATYKLILPIALCFVLIGSPGRSESRKMAWLRRGSSLAGCAMSAWDGYLSAKYLDGHHYLHEANGFLANQDGTIRVGRMAGMKAAFCLVPAIGGEFVPMDYRPAATMASAGATGVFTFIDLHNVGLIRKTSAAHPEAFTPAHVMPGQLR